MAAGHRRLRRIGEVGDVALQIVVIGIPQAACATAGRRPRARRSRARRRVRRRLAKVAGRSGPSATRAAPVRVAKSTISSRLVLRRPGERVGEDQPSFGIGIVDLDGQPLRDLTMSPGPISGAGNGILDRRDKQVEADRQALSMISCASASACAAPPMSFFMIRIHAGCLRSSPPVSKQTPLPTIAMRGSSGLPHSSSIRRGARSGVRRSPDGGDQWIALREFFAAP